jgi:hypothetical protein
MRDSADSDDYGVTRRGRKRGKFDDYDRSYVKRDRHLPRLQAEDARDATDGLPDGDRWSTWDQSETPIPKQCTPRQLVADKLFYAGTGLDLMIVYESGPCA